MQDIIRELLGNPEEKVALITGSESGIGRATAALFLRLGMTLARVDLEDRGQPDAGSGGGQRQAFFAADVGDPRAADAAAGAVARQFGRVDILVNAAGIARDNSEASAMYRVNVDGTVFMARAASSRMPRGGCIVNIGSVVGFVSWPGRDAYSGTKWQVHNLTRQLAVEFAPFGIRVNAVAPGLVDTPLIRARILSLPDPAREFRLRCAQQAAGRMHAPEEIARTILFLATRHSGLMTGAVVDQSGGVAAGYTPNPDMPGVEFETARAQAMWLDPRVLSGER